jgi:hypothetical protein
MYLELFFFILFLGVYFLCYVEMKIHKENEIHVFDRELTRSNVHKETFVKLPFLLDGKHLNEPISKSSLQVIEKKKSFIKYEKDFVSIKLLEPYTRCKTRNVVYYLAKNRRLPLLTDVCSVNYYFIKKGTAKIALIHPKYRDNYQKKEKDFIEFIKENDYIPFLECHENTIVFVPNEWMVYVENNGDKTIVIETIHYQTLVNQFIQIAKKNIMTNKSVS